MKFRILGAHKFGLYIIRMPAMYHSTCVAVPLMWCLCPKSRCIKNGGSHREGKSRSNLFLEQIEKVAIAFRLREDKHYSNMLSSPAGGFALSSAFK